MRTDAARSLDAVVAAVCSLLQVCRRDLMGRSRERRLAHARQLAMAYACVELGLSKSAVARYFQRDRATIYHATRMTTRRLHDDSPRQASLRAAWNHLKRELSIMHKSEPSVNLLEALRNIVRLRQSQLAMANRVGSLSPEATVLESRQLTALVKRLEALELGEPLELAEPYQFADDVLADYVEAHVLRLIGESRHLMAEALAGVASRLGLRHAEPETSADDE